jgi:hypothetical protein
MVTWEVPRYDGGRWFVDLVDDAGKLLDTRHCYPSEARSWDERWEEAYNVRANFMLWKARLGMIEAWGEHEPGTWRGRPNKYSVKNIFAKM